MTENEIWEKGYKVKHMPCVDDTPEGIQFLLMGISTERVQCPDCEDWHVADSLTPLLVDGQLTGRKVCTVCWEDDSGESLIEYLGFSVSGRWLPG